jgi:rod shape-determining protein MreC
VSKNKAIVAFIFVIISFFIFRHCVKAGASVVEVVSSSLLYPLLRVQRAIIVPTAEWFNRRATVSELENKVASLLAENEKLFAENIALHSLHSYAHDTVQLRDFNKRYGLLKGCTAQILVRHFSPTSQFFLVDAGAAQGIKKDMVALYGNNIVGKVVEVYPWYCKVVLITDADCKVSSSVAKAMADKAIMNNDFKGASGIHEGTNNLMATAIRYISHLESVEVGDLVISNGEGLVFPKGFGLGKIVVADKGELFYTVTVQPILDFQALRYCTLIAKEDI